ncbi:MAG TPA: hypothetical protein VGP99_07020, partial [Tepidisphaeraceae bacterium]|nr:hypothetical protein [Tepidisphaeraceae bacterium]
MRALIMAVVLMAGQLAFGQATKPAGKQADVPVKVVVLFSSGVGYFEHIGTVKGDSSTELRFKTQQINDILKSLVLQDTGQGKVSTIVYPSQDPIGKTLSSFQVDISKNPPLGELLNQLRGAKVKVSVGPEMINGTILGLEKRPKAVEKGQIEVWQLNLISGGTVRSIPLEEVTRLDLEDPTLQEELAKALTALAESRGQDKKPVTINFQGEGERLVRVGYVVETPIWKTSYRLLFGQQNAKPMLQGWAIVENQTDNDWENVELSLVSGRPISFIQELYQPLYIPRPVVQPELFASLRPQTYEAGMEMKKEAAVAEREDRLGAMAGNVARRARNAPAPTAAPAGAGLFGQSGRSPAEELADKPIDAAASVASVASATKIGELFQYRVENAISLPRQKSAMIPIITDPVEVEKLSIYNQNVLPKNPLNGARLKNTTKKHLLQGPITVIEAGSYAGDARVDNVPPGQERLLSYGIDLQMLVNATKNKEDTAILSGKIVKGVLHVKRRNVFTQEYVAENKDEKDKTLIIEHPFRQGWKLLEPEKPLETTEALYRFKTTIPASKSGSVTVKEELVNYEYVEILPMDVGTMDFYAKTGQISKAVRDALAKAITLKQQLEQLRRDSQAKQAQINQITQEQVRIRENVKVSPDKSAYRNRLLEKLEEQEKQIDGLLRAKDDLDKAILAKQKEL